MTVALPEDLLKRLKIIAAQQETSLSAMLARTLQQLADQEEGYTAARRGMLEDMRRGYRLGTHGRAAWSRDEIHER